MEPLQAVSVLREFRSRVIAPDMTGRDWDMTALAIESIEAALRPKPVAEQKAEKTKPTKSKK